MTNMSVAEMSTVIDDAKGELLRLSKREHDLETVIELARGIDRRSGFGRQADGNRAAFPADGTRSLTADHSAQQRRRPPCSHRIIFQPKPSA
jgi:hypothetical protein